MYIVIDSQTSLDEFVQKTAQFTKIPATRLKSAISKGYGVEHISVFEKQLTPASILTPSPALDALYDWINDGMGGSIHFDNEGHIGCEEVYSILPPYPGTGQTTPEQIYAHNQFLKASNNLQALVCERADVIDTDDLDMDHFEQSEDTLTDIAKRMGAKPPQDVLDAINALEVAGMHDMASELSELHLAGKVHRFLEDNI
jgi:hypothetical protein